MKKILLTIIAILLPLMASAIAITQNGISYSLDSSTKTAIVSKGTYSGDVNIPPHVTYEGVTYTVTSIGYGAFKGCRGLTFVTIPNNVSCPRSIIESAGAKSKC